jgi:hypothetical protein
VRLTGPRGAVLDGSEGGFADAPMDGCRGSERSARVDRRCGPCRAGGARRGSSIGPARRNESEIHLGLRAAPGPSVGGGPIRFRPSSVGEGSVVVWSSPLFSRGGEAGRDQDGHACGVQERAMLIAGGRRRRQSAERDLPRARRAACRSPSTVTGDARTMQLVRLSCRSWSRDARGLPL